MSRTCVERNVLLSNGRPDVAGAANTPSDRFGVYRNPSAGTASDTFGVGRTPIPATEAARLGLPAPNRWFGPVCPASPALMVGSMAACAGSGASPFPYDWFGPPFAPSVAFGVAKADPAAGTGTVSHDPGTIYTRPAAMTPDFGHASIYTSTWPNKSGSPVVHTSLSASHTAQARPFGLMGGSWARRFSRAFDGSRAVDGSRGQAVTKMRSLW